MRHQRAVETRRRASGCDEQAIAPEEGQQVRRALLIRAPRRLGALGLVAGIVIGACSGASSPSPSGNAGAGASGAAAVGNCAPGSITAAGSTALQPLVDKAAKGLRGGMRRLDRQRSGWWLGD